MKTLYNNDPEKTAHLNKRRVHQASLKITENCWKFIANDKWCPWDNLQEIKFNSFIFHWPCQELINILPIFFRKFPDFSLSLKNTFFGWLFLLTVIKLKKWLLSTFSVKFEHLSWDLRTPKTGLAPFPQLSSFMKS